VCEPENRYGAAFSKKYLLNDSHHDEFLTPEFAATNEPGVLFQRKDQAQ
jgi:hypothetical protein